MMNFLNRINYKLAFFGAVACLFSGESQALITCALSAARTDTLQIKPINISAGPDLPLGSVIYRGTWRDTNYQNQIKCTSNLTVDDSGKMYSELGIESASFPLSSWSGSPYPGKVYTTNIPGIGVAVWYAGNAVTTTSSHRMHVAEFEVDADISTLFYGFGSSFDISLVKIGTTPPGSYAVNALTFPTAKHFFSAYSNVAGLPITVRRINFSGSLTVSAQTCTTPDVNVPLGVHDVSEFSSTGSATPWVNFNVQLTNCPEFKGYYSGSNPVELTTGTYGASTSNQYGLRLSPTSSVIDSANGIMSVTPAIDAASGIGIQIASDNSGTKVPFNFSAEKTYDATKSGASTINIPMAARYIKTSSSMIPGKANGKVTFTINYY
ncbi:TPA: type 1 fimbrial protein [Klebsiella aerogenes]|nr:type 1 fimbrial protein [Klebsiella aerogenes]